MHISPKHLVAAVLAGTIFLYSRALIRTAYAVDPARQADIPAMIKPFSGVTERLSEGRRYAAEAELPTARRAQGGGQTYPIPNLEHVNLQIGKAGTVFLSGLPELNTSMSGKLASISQNNDFVFYSINKELQDFATKLVQDAKAPHVVLVAIEPSTGQIISIVGKSDSLPRPELYSGFPAASLFKLVTSTAAIERGGLAPETLVGFRGGTYTLNRWNYAPGIGRDNRSMSLADALGKSCNPVFSRVALSYLNPEVMRTYTKAFGFNSNLRFDLPLPPSQAIIPDADFDLGRTAAGFGEVNLSPIHAAAFIAGIANGGVMLRPSLIDSVITQSGALAYRRQPEILGRIMSAGTSQTLMEMMQRTTTNGTSKRAFMRKNQPIMPNIPVAAKTGTLSGENPKGINNWFVAAAPMDNPKLALAVLVVHPAGQHIKASQIGRMFIQKYFNQPVTTVEPLVKKTYKYKKKPLYKRSYKLTKKKKK